MGNKEIYRSSKDKNIRINAGRRYNEILQDAVARDVQKKATSGIVLGDKNDFNNGFMWFKNGLSLNDADSVMKNNQSFVNGFRKAERLELVNQFLYEEGKKFFEQGLSLDVAPDNYKNSVYFMQGYNCTDIRKK